MSHLSNVVFLKGRFLGQGGLGFFQAIIEIAGNNGGRSLSYTEQLEREMPKGFRPYEQELLYDPPAGGELCA